MDPREVDGVSSNEHDTFVTERLAGGLARQAIRDWRDRVHRSEARLLELTRRDFSTSKGVARVARELRNLIEPIAFHSQAKEFKRKGVYQASTLPQLRAIDGTEYLAVEASLFAVDLAGFRRLGHRLLACIHPHALARMFLRMQTTELVEVRKQIDSCLHFYPALADACRVLQLRQIIIPTREGHFRCDVRMDLSEPAMLVAKTWLVTDAHSVRDLNVLSSIAGALVTWNERASDAEQGQMCLSMEAPESLVQLMVDRLRAHTWLTEPYEERPDRLSAIWEAARRQAG
jgi:hypothetical protein